jgi:hypothetical protein
VKGLEALWDRRRQFLVEWTLASTAQCIGISRDFAQRYPQEYSEVALWGTHAFIEWGERRPPRVILSASQAWTAILATVHVDQLRGHEYRVCARKGCGRLLPRKSAKGHVSRFCGLRCRNADNVGRYGAAHQVRKSKTTISRKHQGRPKRRGEKGPKPKRKNGAISPWHRQGT